MGERIANCTRKFFIDNYFLKNIFFHCCSENKFLPYTKCEKNVHSFQAWMNYLIISVHYICIDQNQIFNCYVFYICRRLPAGERAGRSSARIQPHHRGSAGGGRERLHFDQLDPGGRYPWAAGSGRQLLRCATLQIQIFMVTCWWLIAGLFRVLSLNKGYQKIWGTFLLFHDN